jgi:hypothetical protein
LLWHEIGKRRAAEAVDQQSQARLVSAWAIAMYAAAYGDPMPKDLDAALVNVEYRNGSEEPIYAVTLWVRHHHGPDAGTTPMHLGLVAPRTQKEVQLEQVPLPPDLLSLPPVEVTFTDAHLQHWRRDGLGDLHLLPENPHVGVC